MKIPIEILVNTIKMVVHFPASYVSLQECTPPKFNSEFTPEKWWLEDDPFLLGFGNFSGANC